MGLRADNERADQARANVRHPAHHSCTRAHPCGSTESIRPVPRYTGGTADIQKYLPVWTGQLVPDCKREVVGPLL